MECDGDRLDRQDNYDRKHPDAEDRTDAEIIAAEQDATARRTWIATAAAERKNASSKPKLVWPSLDDLIAALESDEYIGFCLACGAEAYCVEPDAENYRCEDCGRNAVQGAENVLLSHPEA